MSAVDPTFRRAFHRPPRILARITPKGFAFLEEQTPELTGRIGHVRLIRKLFEEGFLTCSSSDGVRARNGTVCDDCRHPRCQPRLRIHIHERHAVFVLDLAYSSARNLLRLQHELRSEGLPLDDVNLQLSVKNRGRWGEVIFERLEPRPTPPGAA
jgi:hypothetical protein